MFEKLSPSPRPLVSSRHPRPHEGLSRVVLKGRGGSGACGAGPPNPRLGRLSRNGFMPALSVALLDGGRSESLARAARTAWSSAQPPARHYDREAATGGLVQELAAAMGGDLR